MTSTVLTGSYDIDSDAAAQGERQSDCDFAAERGFSINIRMDAEAPLRSEGPVHRRHGEPA